MVSQYDDIIKLPHYELKFHKRMSRESRAAQFAPFAALTGYQDAIQETGRVTDIKHELDEDTSNEINSKLLIINKNIRHCPKVKVIYFVADKKKSGGKYIVYENRVKRVDYVNRKLYFIDSNSINFDDIMGIELIDCL